MDDLGNTGRFELVSQKYAELLPLLDAILRHMREQNAILKDLSQAFRRSRQVLSILLFLSFLLVVATACLLFSLHSVSNHMDVTTHSLLEVVKTTAVTDKKLDAVAEQAANTPTVDIVSAEGTGGKTGQMKVVVRPPKVDSSGRELPPAPSIEIPVVQHEEAVTVSDKKK